ncbi:hypothetical protein D1BOALGB6SA_2801 [Olavius sp. associated proteobacterium Delta 1]|nr:hypothetical protein D1BOALGB6SA_2801 [Olavius sp. associated proteobacterium Delta 1]
MMPFTEHNINSGIHIITDGWKGYYPLDNKKYSHQKVC